MPLDSTLLRNLLHGGGVAAKKEDQLATQNLIRTIVEQETHHEEPSSGSTKRRKITAKDGNSPKRKSQSKKLQSKLSGTHRRRLTQAMTLERARMALLQHNNIHEYASIAKLDPSTLEVLERQFFTIRNTVHNYVERISEGMEQLLGNDAVNLTVSDAELLLDYARLGSETNPTTFEKISDRVALTAMKNGSSELSVKQFLQIVDSVNSSRFLVCAQAEKCGLLTSWQDAWEKSFSVGGAIRAANEKAARLRFEASLNHSEVLLASQFGDLTNGLSSDSMASTLFGPPRLDPAEHDEDNHSQPHHFLRSSSMNMVDFSDTGNSLPPIQKSSSVTTMSIAGSKNEKSHRLPDKTRSVISQAKTALASSSNVQATESWMDPTADLATLRRELAMANESVTNYTRMVDDNIAWVQKNCELPPNFNQRMSDRARRKCQSLGLQKLFAVLEPINQRTLFYGWYKWVQVNSMQRFQQMAIRYSKLKSIHMMTTSLAGIHLKTLLYPWKKWIDYVKLKIHAEQSASCTKIQTHIRACLARKRVLRIRTINAAILLQSVIRRHLAYKRVADLRILLQNDKAAKQIANYFAGIVSMAKARNELIARRRKKAAILIQKHVRGMYGRQRFVEIAAAGGLRQSSPTRAIGDLDALAASVRGSTQKRLDIDLFDPLRYRHKSRKSTGNMSTVSSKAVATPIVNKITRRPPGESTLTRPTASSINSRQKVPTSDSSSRSKPTRVLPSKDKSSRRTVSADVTDVTDVTTPVADENVTKINSDESILSQQTPDITTELIAEPEISVIDKQSSSLSESIPPIDQEVSVRELTAQAISVHDELTAQAIIEAQGVYERVINTSDGGTIVSTDEETKNPVTFDDVYAAVEAQLQAEVEVHSEIDIKTHLDTDAGLPSKSTAEDEEMGEIKVAIEIKSETEDIDETGDNTHPTVERHLSVEPEFASEVDESGECIPDTDVKPVFEVECHTVGEENNAFIDLPANVTSADQQNLSLDSKIVQTGGLLQEELDIAAESETHRSKDNEFIDVDTPVLTTEIVPFDVETVLSVDESADKDMNNTTNSDNILIEAVEKSESVDLNNTINSPDNQDDIGETGKIDTNIFVDNIHNDMPPIPKSTSGSRPLSATISSAFNSLFNHITSRPASASPSPTRRQEMSSRPSSGPPLSRNNRSSSPSVNRRSVSPLQWLQRTFSGRSDKSAEDIPLDNTDTPATVDIPEILDTLVESEVMETICEPVDSAKQLLAAIVLQCWARQLQATRIVTAKRGAEIARQNAFAALFEQRLVSAQALIRGFIGRSRVNRLRLKNKEAYRLAMVVRIQSCVRGFIARIFVKEIAAQRSESSWLKPYHPDSKTAATRLTEKEGFSLEPTVDADDADADNEEDDVVTSQMVTPSKQPPTEIVTSPVAVSAADEAVTAKLAALEALEERMKLAEANLRAEAARAEERMAAQMAVLESQARKVEQERRAQEELLRIAAGSQRGTARSSSRTARGSFNVFGTQSHAAPPSARSARDGKIPSDAPRLTFAGREWLQLWDPDECAYYWWCPLTKEAQWEQPGMEAFYQYAESVIDEAMSGDERSESGLESTGALTDYSTDYDSDYGSDMYTNSGWQEYWDEQAQAKYWYNNNTGEASWTMPEVLVNLSRPTTQRTERFSADAGWVSYLDEATGQLYWHNVNTGEVQWDV